MSMILNGKKSLLNVTFIGGETPQEKVVTPTTEEQIVQADEGYTCLSKVIINGVNSSIDENIQPENIKKDVNILGVTGTLESGGGEEYKETLNKLIDGSIEEIESEASEITDYKFNYCTSLTTISFPNATSIGYYAFNYCTSLTTISFPNATSISYYAFNNCVSLTTISFPNATSIGNYAFYNCVSLTTISFPNATSIGNYAFARADALTSITLGANQVCTIASTNSIPAKSNQHITIKVPADLIESYKTATNWSTHYNNGYITFEAIA